MLARREHSAFELRRKLLQKGFVQTDIEAGIAQLQTEGLLSDRRFAESYIHMRKGKGYGPLRIAQELKAKGVAERDFKQYLDAGDQDWSTVLRHVYQKKYGDQTCDNMNEKAKRTRYLQYRGFDLQAIRELLE